MNEKEAIVKFKSFYSRFDKRLARARKVQVKEMPGGYYVSCTFCGCGYGQFYAK